jgi:hypothetical protein
VLKAALNSERDEEEFSLGSRNSCSKVRSPASSEIENELFMGLNKENEKLKSENIELKLKLDCIDRKFDKLSDENSEMKTYVKEKSENFDEMKKVLGLLYGEVSEMKKVRQSTPTPDKTSSKHIDQSVPFKKCDFFLDDNIINTERSDDIRVETNNLYTDSVLQKKPELPRLSIIPKGGRLSTEVNNVSHSSNGQLEFDSDLDSRNRTGCFLQIDQDSITQNDKDDEEDRIDNKGMGCE